MPSRSRKKIKGQARKAKANAAAADSIIVRAPHPPTNCTTCDHGQEFLPDVCNIFMTSFFNLFVSNMNLKGVVMALNDAYNKSPEAVNNDKYREICKKSFICNGTLSLLRTTWANSYGCAAAVMIIDSYVPSLPMSPGVIDQRDAKELMTNLDIIGGCRRSLVKYFVSFHLETHFGSYVFCCMVSGIFIMISYVMSCHDIGYVM